MSTHPQSSTRQGFTFSPDAMQYKLVSLLALAAVALGAPGDIPYDFAAEQLNNVNTACADFNEAIANWSGNYMGALALINQSKSIVQIITKAVAPPPADWSSKRAAVDMGSGSDEDALQNAFDNAEKVATEVGKTTDTAIAAKSKFAKVPLVGLTAARVAFQSIETVAGKLGDAYTQNSMPDRQAEAREISNTIQDHLKRGIAAFQ